jgi:hypothetical protein
MIDSTTLKDYRITRIMADREDLQFNMLSSKGQRPDFLHIPKV